MGGAALVPYRLFTRIQEKNPEINVTFLVMRKTSTDSRVIQLLPKFLLMIERIINKFFNFLGLQYFFLPFSTVSLLYHAITLKPDVISLQNIHGGYFWLPLLWIFGKLFPVVWTVHDVWPVHRNSAFFIGYDHWKKMKPFPKEKDYYPQIGFNTGSLLLKYKQLLYKFSDFSVITPSRWLKDIMQASPLMKSKSISHIYNGVDLTIWQSQQNSSKSILRKHNGVPENEKVIVFIAAFLDIPLKGMKELITVLALLDEKIAEPITVLCIGAAPQNAFPAFSHIKVKETGYISDQAKIRDYFALSDLFLYPSKAESLGMVLVESIASGTPVITFDIGGCPEVVRNGVNGYTIPPFDTTAFAERTIELLNNPSLLASMSKAGKRIAQQDFNLDTMADNYLELINQTIERYGKKTH